MKTTKETNYNSPSTEKKTDIDGIPLVKSAVLRSIRPQKSMMKIKSFKPKRIVSARKVHKKAD